MPATAMAGVATRNANRAASSSVSPAPTVASDRLMAGSRARIWAVPMGNPLVFAWARRRSNTIAAASSARWPADRPAPARRALLRALGQKLVPRLQRSRPRRVAAVADPKTSIVEQAKYQEP